MKGRTWVRGQMLVPVLLPLLAAPLLAATALPLGLQDPAAADERSGGRTELGEGPLDNDVFLPVARGAELELARGDEAFVRLRAAPTSEASERAWVEVLEGWHRALGAGDPGESVAVRPWLAADGLDSPWGDPDGTAGGGAADRRARRTESLEGAVVRRLLALEPEDRRAWTERFTNLAAEELALAGRSRDGLTRVERLHPATGAAASAALALAEMDLEEGRVPLARTWLERAARHALLAEEPNLAEAIRRRAAVAVSLAPPPGPDPATETWRRATSLEFLAEIPLEDLSERRFVYRPRPGVRLQPDVAWLEGNLVALQTEDRALVLDLTDGRRLADFKPLDLVAQAGHALSPRDPPPDPPGWPARPAAGEGRIVFVLRSRPPALACVSLGASDLFGGLRLPRLEWAVVGARRTGPDTNGPTELERWPEGVIQPGPVIHAGTVFVQVHEADEEAGSRSRAYLVALDLADGRVRFTRLLARGAPLSRTSLRFLDESGAEAVGQPLAMVGDAVLVGTHLGAAALVEACDGRPAWSFVYRRRPGRGDRWTGEAPVVFDAPVGALLAPADSDRAYWLRGRADLEGKGLLLHPPLSIGEAEVLIGGDARRAVVLTRSGRERALAEWDGANGSRLEAPWLAPGEVFTGLGAVSPERVLFATDRTVYLHDRGRGLYLIDHESYPRPFPAAGGRVIARGDRVLVLGPHLAWVLAAR